MAAHSNATRIGVFGASGSGKSLYIKSLIKNRRRVVIIDTELEYSAAVKIEHRNRADLDRVRQAMVEDWPGFRVAYAPPSAPARMAEAVSKLCNLLMEAQRPYKRTGKGAPILLVAEEMNQYFHVNGGADKCPGLAEICSRGRHYGIELVGASQRIAEVSTRFRGNLSELVVLMQSDRVDVDRAAQSLDKTAAEVRDLDKLEYFRRVGRKISRGRVAIPTNKTSVA